MAEQPTATVSEVLEQQLEEVTPNVTLQLQNFAELALNNIKVYKPEIARLDARITELSAGSNQLEEFMKKIKGEQAEDHERVVQGVESLDVRLSKFETLLAALPVWKEDILQKIDAVSRESRAKDEQLLIRLQALEETHVHNMTATRERLDTLTAITRTAADARQQLSERLDTLDKLLRNIDSMNEMRINAVEQLQSKQSTELTVNTRKITELSIAHQIASTDVEQLKRVTDTHSEKVDLISKDVISLFTQQDTQTQTLEVKGRRITQLEKSRDSNMVRLEALEKDTRLPTLQIKTEHLERFRDTVGGFMNHTTSRESEVDSKLLDLAVKCERGPPTLWKVTNAVAAVADELQQAQSKIVAATLNVDSLSRSHEDVKSLLTQQREAFQKLQADSHENSDKMEREFQKAMAYTDSRLDGLARQYEIEALRKTMADMRADLFNELANSSYRVKFELLHDEVPQVASLKDYMASVEQSSLRMQERLACVEEALHTETERANTFENNWRSTKNTIDTVLLDGDFDAAGMRREIQRLSHMFTDLAAVANKGGVLTGRQVDELVDMKLKSPLMDDILKSKFAITQLSDLQLRPVALQTDLDELRRNIINLQSDLNSKLAGGGGAPASPGKIFSSAQVALSNSQAALSSPRLDTVPRIASAGARPLSGGTGGGARTAAERQDAAAAAAAANGSQAVEAGESDAMIVEQGRANAGSLGIRVAALEASLESMVLDKLNIRSTAGADKDATLTGIETHLEQIQATLNAVSATGLLSGGVEEIVRRQLHLTLLPELLERQAAEGRRLQRHVETLVAQMAPRHDMETLRKTLTALSAGPSRLLAAGQPPGGGGGTAAVVSASVGSTPARALSPGPEGGMAEPSVTNLASADTASSDGTRSPGLGDDDSARGAAGEEDAAFSLSASSPAAAAAASAPGGGGAALAGEPTAPFPGAGLSSADASQMLLARIATLEQIVSRLAAAALTTGSGGGGTPLALEVDLLKGQLADLAASVEVVQQVQRLHQAPLGRPVAAAAAQASEGALEEASSESVRRGAAPPPPPPVGSSELEAAVLELRVRVHAFEMALPGLAKVYEVEALRRNMLDVLGDRALSGRAASAARGVPSGPIGQQMLLGTDVLMKLGALESVATLLDERSKLLEAEFTTIKGRWQFALVDLHTALPKVTKDVGMVKAAVEELRRRPAVVQASTPVSPNATRVPSGRAKSTSPERRNGSPQRETSGLHLSGGLGDSGLRLNPDAEHVDVEIAGIAHDMLLAMHDQVRRTRTGPLPDAMLEPEARDAALRRLDGKPGEVGRHVEMLENIRRHLDRLVVKCASSTVDNVALASLIIDMRVMALEDLADMQKGQVATIYHNLESCFEYLKKLQEAVNAKAPMSAVVTLEQELRMLGPDASVRQQQQLQLQQLQLQQYQQAEPDDQSTPTSPPHHRSVMSPYLGARISKAEFKAGGAAADQQQQQFMSSSSNGGGGVGPAGATGGRSTPMRTSRSIPGGASVSM